MLVKPASSVTSAPVVKGLVSSSYHIISISPTDLELKNYSPDKWFSPSYHEVNLNNIELNLLVEHDLAGTAAADKKVKLVRQLLDYLNLPENWDGYEGIPPKRRAIGDAIRLINQLPDSIPVPKPMLGGLGVVGLYWDKQGIYADVCFEGDGTFWYYAKDVNGNKVGEDEVYLSNSLPVPLLKVISILTH